MVQVKVIDTIEKMICRYHHGGDFSLFRVHVHFDSFDYNRSTHNAQFVTKHILITLSCRSVDTLNAIAVEGGVHM